MKYPLKDYRELVNVLEQLAPYFEIGNMQPNQLHYLAYQQTSKGQPHNRIYLTDQGLQRFHSMRERCIEKVNKGINKPIVNVDFELELYPIDCNDSHVATATKKAVKEVLINGSIKHKSLT